MSKIIKKFFRYINFVVAIIVALAALLFLLARTPKFQSYVAGKFMTYISKKTGANVSVGKISYSYFNKLVVYDILIKDQNNDTLCSVPQISLKIKEFNPASQKFRFGNAEVYQPDFRMITDTAGISNLRWYLGILSGSDGKKRDTTNNLLLSFSKIKIYDGSYQLVNKKTGVEQKEGIIDFNRLRIDSINGNVEEFAVCPDSVSFKIKNLAFSESTGFDAYDLNTSLAIKNGDLYFDGLRLITGSSIINAPEISLVQVDSVGFADFFNKVKCNFDFERSTVSTHDLAFFAAPFAKINDSFYLSGNFSGPIAELKGRKVELEYASATRLKCNFDVSGLPNIDNTFAFIDISEFRTIADDIEKIKIEGKKETVLPDLIHKFGKISFGGNFTGFSTDFVAYGTVKTEKGNFSGDISFRPDSADNFRFKGLLKARDIDMATLTGDKNQQGNMWLHADVDGFSTSFSHFAANLKGAVDSVTYNNYKYTNIRLEGKITEKKWDGSVRVNDKNIAMDILGSFDFSDNLPEFNFTLNLANANLFNLNFVRSDSLFKASALLTASFKGDNIDNLNGDVRLLKASMTNSAGTLAVKSMVISSGSDKGTPLLTLTSDFADGEIRGPHNYASIGSALKSELAKLFPSKFTNPLSPTDVNKNNFTYKVVFKEINQLNAFLKSGIEIAPNSEVYGIFHPDSSHVTLKVNSELFGLKGNYFRNLKADGAITGNKVNMIAGSDSIMFPEKSVIKSVALKIYSHPDTLHMGINWDNNDNGATKGKINVLGYVSYNSDKKPVIQVNLLPTEAFVNSAKWNINAASVVIDSSLINFRDFLIDSNDKYFSLDGKVSSDPEDVLTLKFKGLDLAYLNRINSRNKSGNNSGGGMDMTVEGRVDGDVRMSDSSNDIRIESDIKIDNFVFNDSHYGKVNVGSEWDPDIRALKINIFNDFEGMEFFNVNGTYKPAGKAIKLNAVLNKMPVNVFNPLLSSFASDTRGLASGKIHLNGQPDNLQLTGALKADEASLRIDFLKTRYSFSDSVRFTRQGIVFNNIRIFDEKKNQGTVNGILKHKSFRNMALDLTFNVKNCQVLKTTYKDSEYFYGTAYATGIATIKGPVEKLAFNISARTENNTNINIPLNTGATVGEYPYIMFINSGEESQKLAEQDNMFVKKEKKSGIDLNLDLEVTPNAMVQLIMDSKTGDIIKGKGSGNLNISLDSKGVIKMAGDYVIKEGSYLFTLGNVINKSFTIKQGGTITWNGGLTDAILDLKAFYGTRASLYDIYYHDEALRKKLDVECQLNLSGKLMNPMVELNIDAPNADNETREYLKMAINTQEDLSKQFLYLLVMNSFCPDPSIYSSASSQSTSQGAFAVGLTTTEMLSNQLSNWLSQISNDFDVGFTYRPGNELTTQEVEAAFSTQLLNDRVTFNGNVDVGGKQSNANASNVTTDFTLEYNLTDKLKFKAFNRSNDEILYETAPYTQGFGILYRHEFNKIKDLVRKKGKDEKNKTDESKKTGK